MTAQFSIDYIETDAECVDLHRFLCLISQPVLLASIDADASMAEVIKVRDEGISLVARLDGHLIGALGLVETGFWYNPKAKFFTDRWFFVYPMFANAGIGAALLAEAAAITTTAGRLLVINGKIKQRARTLGNGVFFASPDLIRPAPEPPPPRPVNPTAMQKH